MTAFQNNNILDIPTISKSYYLYLQLMLMMAQATGSTIAYNQHCEGVLPFHAVSLPATNTCTWTCSDGYYSSTPISPGGISTCRPCNKPHICGIGWTQLQCTPTTNSICAQCPLLTNIVGRQGEVYSKPNDCLSTVCGDGWYQNTTQCLPCPPGAFCIGGILYSCGANCSTGTAGGASSLLECKQTTGPDLAFSVKFTLSGTSLASDNSKCPALNIDIIAWLQHGTFQGCTLDFLTATLATATCTVTAAHCIAGEYLRWLLQQLSMRQSQTTRHLALCLQAPNLFVAAPLVEQNLLFLSTNKARRDVPPTDAPLLIIEPPKWGVSHAEALAVLGLALLVCLGLTVALLLLCAMWRTSASRQTITSKLYDKIQAKHLSSKVKHSVHTLKVTMPKVELKRDVP